MRLSGKRVGTLGEQDILNLIANRVAESRTRDFKRELPGKSDDDRKEFLADASALANTDGGVIVYGLDTVRDAHGDTGIARAVTGITGNVDREQQRLLSMLQDGLEPSLTAGVEIQHVPVLSQSAAVLVVGIAPSLSRPHRVVFKKWHKFWRRSEAGKYQPDTVELRRMFLESASWVEECERFREQRLSVVAANPLLDHSSTLLIHLLPMGRLKHLVSLNAGVREMRDAFQPPFRTMGRFRYNADGFITAGGLPNNLTHYSQVFRFGGVEGFTSQLVVADPRGHGKRLLLGDSVSTELEQYVMSSMAGLRDLLQVEPPLCLLVTLRGVRAVEISGAGTLSDSVYPELSRIDVDELVLPPEVIEFDTSVGDVCGLLSDVIWQAGGYSGRPPPDAPRWPPLTR